LKDVNLRWRAMSMFLSTDWTSAQIVKWVYTKYNVLSKQKTKFDKGNIIQKMQGIQRKTRRSSLKLESFFSFSGSYIEFRELSYCFWNTHFKYRNKRSLVRLQQWAISGSGKVVVRFRRIGTLSGNNYFTHVTITILSYSLPLQCKT